MNINTEFFNLRGKWCKNNINECKRFIKCQHKLLIFLDNIFKNKMYVFDEEDTENYLF